MSDLFERVTADQDIFKKILSKVPGFNGYIERQNRRSADKLLRETIANRFEEQWQRISALQRDLISQGGLAYVDDLEASAIKIRQFIDRVRTASYGFAGFFDAVKVNQEELARIYQYDYAMLQLADEVSRGIDNVEASLGTDGLPAAIRHLTSLARQAVEAFDRRAEVILGGEAPAPTQPAA
ncbi:MAG TPA: hypothetical protein VHO48_12520 [Anaerolineaceae bacterium]|nr:hypothetical protein [Anaerolineaceae bacterium]